jgi:hypothetical protein
MVQVLHEEIDENEPINAQHAKKKDVRAEKLILRNYSKSVLLYPLAICSGVALLLQWIMNPMNDPTLVHGSLAMVWLVVFLANIFAISFDYLVVKFVGLALVSLLIILVLVLLTAFGVIFAPGTTNSTVTSYWLAIYLPTQFYLYVTGILGLIIFSALVSARLSYLKIDQNELDVKGVLTGGVSRYPTSGITYEKKISNVFGFLFLGAGTITINVPDVEPIKLDNVIHVNKKAKILHELLSSDRSK